MKSPRSFLSKKSVVIVSLALLAVTAAVAFGFNQSKKETNPLGVDDKTNPAVTAQAVKNLSKVILSVKDMSCSGCISTIKGSLSGMDGIKDIVVDLSAGTAEVYFDGGKNMDVSQIARAITESGYPAEVLRVLSPKELEKETDIAAAKSKFYIASVGGYDIARADFVAELEVAKRKYEKIYGADIFTTAQGRTLMDNLKVQILSSLIDESVFMQEITKSGFRVDSRTVDGEIQELLKKNGKNLTDFREQVEQVGYNFDYFKKKFEIKILINKYLNERILTDASNDFEKENLFKAWFRNAKVVAGVVYYDTDLEKLMQAKASSGGCGAAG
ncbi:MAG: cation transporter [Pseudomonadota bacterium]